MKNILDKLTATSKRKEQILKAKRIKREKRAMWLTIKKAANHGLFDATLYTCDFYAEDYTELAMYFTEQGFYVRKYHFGFPYDNLQVAWGEGIKYHRHMDELQVQMIKERNEEE